ncbi:MAG: hypothetical protein Q4B77_03875 [Coriobacteriaceae bacterium]|nr:hypothetical protein [Coriobacteriaceae bacterium]
MDTPSFNYGPVNSSEQNQQGSASNTADAGQRLVESASASTAPQQNSSNFAYYLTAGVLGITALFLIGIVSLCMNVFEIALSRQAETTAQEQGEREQYWEFEDQGYGYDDLMSEYGEDTWL